MCERVPRDEIVSAAFTVRDGWYAGQESSSYAFQCGDFSPGVISGTLVQMEHYSDEYIARECPTEEEKDAFYDMLDTLRQAVEHGVDLLDED